MTDIDNRTIPIGQEEIAYLPENREFPTKQDMDPVRKLILEKVEETGTDLKALSKAIGKNHAYMQQFIRRGVPKTLDEDIRPALAQKLGLDPNQLKIGSTGRNLSLSNHNDKPVKATIAPNALTEVNSNHKGQPLGALTPGEQLVGEADLPVFAMAQGGRGALIVTENAVDWVVRPDPLLRVRDGYGMIVAGDSMSPKIDAGSTALVNPHLPPRQGDLCIFRRHADDGTVEACIKELVRATDDVWYVKQYNPKRTFTLKRAQWQVCHVTVGTYFSR